MADVTTLPVEQLEHRLRLWSAQHDPHVHAAVELLIEHDVWLHRRAFVAAVHLDNHDDTAWIDFTEARDAFKAGRFDASSSTEQAVLDLVIALGQDRYRFSRMGTANSAQIVKAVTCALRDPGDT